MAPASWLPNLGCVRRLSGDGKRPEEDSKPARTRGRSWDGDADTPEKPKTPPQRRQRASPPSSAKAKREKSELESRLVAGAVSRGLPRTQSRDGRSRSRSRSRSRVLVPAAPEPRLTKLDGYREDIDELIAAHGFPVGPGRPAYLDFAGAGLISEQHSMCAEALLRKLPPGNPHSSEALRSLLQDVRHQVLRYFNAPPERYSVVFTANATAATRIVAEHFPYTQHSVLAYDRDCHTSTMGLRCRARHLGAAVGWYDTEQLERLNLDDLRFLSGGPAGESGFSGPNLLAVTGESNFSGNVASLDSLRRLREGPLQWRIFLDAAKLACSEPIDLERTPVDFMSVSFYKMFGRPHGLGALLVHSEAAPLLLRASAEEVAYFGGGTVAAASATDDFAALVTTNVSTRFELGTPNTAAIAELPAAFAQNLHSSLAAAGRHSKSLAREAAERMRRLRHSGPKGGRVIKLYGAWASEEGAPASQGATIAFNVVDKDGDHYPCTYVELQARTRFDLMMRCGSLCNHGACEKYLGLTPEDIRANYSKGHTCQAPTGIGVRGVPTGALRVSFGAASTLQDVDRLSRFLGEFVDRSSFWDILQLNHERKLAEAEAA
eukprot:TRINITY_DN14981_c0_g4_i1.p1 TRINITY_DN14981_c0_g4~~TRINITY_DN14981_c0_g4_i1.p1  ORF type:complete len:605 (-),score=122.48 TRINITY_DN14981_c0_g4_i1:108-1922(-)